MDYKIQTTNKNCEDCYKQIEDNVDKLSTLEETLADNLTRMIKENASLRASLSKSEKSQVRSPDS